MHLLMSCASDERRARVLLWRHKCWVNPDLSRCPTFVAPTQVWIDPTVRIGQDVVRSIGRGCGLTNPSREGWVTVLPEELWVCAAAEVTRRRPAAPPERARYMASQASSRRRAPPRRGSCVQWRGMPSTWRTVAGTRAVPVRRGPGAGRTAVSKNLNNEMLNVKLNPRTQLTVQV